MKKILILLFVSLFSLSASAKTNCFPNLVMVDVCTIAKTIATGAQAELPIPQSSTSAVTSVFALGPSLNFTIQYDEDRAEFDAMANRGASNWLSDEPRINVDAIMKLVSINTKRNYCNAPERSPLRAFLDLGGELRAVGKYSDGIIAWSLAIKRSDC